MSTLLSLMDIQQYQARIPLPGAKKNVYFNCFSLLNSDIVVVVENGLTNIKEQTLFASLLQACQHSIEIQLANDAWQEARKILWFGQFPPDKVNSEQIKFALCPHPAKILSGELKPLVYKILLKFFH